MKRVLIAEDSGELTRRLKALLKETFQVRAVRDEEGLRKAVEEFKPELLVLDMQLPKLDPVAFLKELSGQKQLQVLALTVYVSGYLTQALSDTPVSYLMVQPCQPEKVADRVRDLIEEARDAKQKKLREIMRDCLSIPLERHGGSYLLSAIPIAMASGRISLTKELYPSVGDEFGAHWRLVERSMRTAIEIGWNRGDPAQWRRWFPHGKPNNGLFIYTIAEFLRTCSPDREFPDDSWEKESHCG